MTREVPKGKRLVDTGQRRYPRDSVQTAGILMMMPINSRDDMKRYIEGFN